MRGLALLRWQRKDWIGYLGNEGKKDSIRDLLGDTYLLQESQNLHKHNPPLQPQQQDRARTHRFLGKQGLSEALRGRRSETLEDY